MSSSASISEEMSERASQSGAPRLAVVNPLCAGLAAAGGSVPAALLLSLTGFAFVFGHDGLDYGLGLLSGLVLAAVLIAPRFRATGAATLVDFMRARFGAGVAMLVGLVVVSVLLVLLAADLSFAGLVAEQHLGAGYEVGMLAAAVVAAALAVIGGARCVTWSQAAFYIVLAGALLFALVLLSVSLLGPVSLLGLGTPHLGYGAALQEIAALETKMLEGGMADLRSFRPFAKPFLDLDALNHFALVLTLAAGTAALPHLAMRFAAVRSVRAARLGSAWSAFFVMVILITIPALAVLAKLGLLRMIVGGTAFAALPAWMESLSRLDLLRIHGVSVAMLADVARALQSGAVDVAGVTAYLKSEAAMTSQGWIALKPTAKTAVLDAARLLASSVAPDAWEALKSTVLPAAALAAGNKTGLLTHSGLVMAPQALPVLIAGLTAAPAAVSGFLAAGAFAAVLATASGLMLAVGLTVSSSANAARAVVGVVALAAAAAAVLLLRSADLASLVIAALSVVASALFPPIALGLWWRRTSAWGAALGLTAGLSVAVFYVAGTQLFPAAFYEIWPTASNASEPMVHKFESLKLAWTTAAAGEAKDAAFAALQTLARGTVERPGVANWLGVRGSSAAVFGLPVAFLVTIVASLLMPSSREREEGP